MAVYVDQARIPYRGMVMSHMVADTLDELHAMASRVGMKREWFQPRSFPHYDLPEPRRAHAVELGAVEIGQRELGRFMRSRRAQFPRAPREGGA